ncbi:lysine-2,3-aminomutase-like protein [Azorhizobium doebereinerae]|uniref:lysine-2,3-aminomutase-like protein n=1 Tax=Azorhizobium doebereinerae TaxID=281091 RepID=UPI000419B1BF|nr:lysine-2,3-aminomutase-like protein [Azorhizobium doebereinerae]
MSTLRTADDLIAAGLAPAARRAALAAVAGRYAVAVTPELAAAIDRADPADPIARQFVPDAAELEVDPRELADPIGDDAHSPVPGIVHRYPDRVLLKLVGVCAVYCRFCFRREMVGPGAEQALSPEALDGALAYVAAHPEVWEVILTGGDPFMLSPRRMAEVVGRLAAISHVKVVRFHTRVPIAAPERVTAEMVAALKAQGIASYVAVHANHARELGDAATAALARLADAGIPLVSQTVLLRGVNDDAETLAALFRALVERRVKPYYLHHPDLAPGTAHFRLSIAEGQGVMRALRGRLSGLAVPTYVLDIPGGAGKVPLTPGYAARQGGGWQVADNCGGLHAYADEAGEAGAGR